MTTHRTLLVDGDILLYRYGWRHQESVDWGGGVVSTWCSTPEEVIYDCRTWLEELKKTLNAKSMIICLTGRAPFRYDLLSTYKHNRKNAVKPILYPVLTDWMMDTYAFRVYDYLEADDCMGIMATIPGLAGERVICTIDKDLEQIPGKHYNWDKDEDIRVVTEYEANYAFYFQCLTGDTADGYSGCPSIGTKRAKVLLDSIPVTPTWHRDVWQMIVATYASKGLPESYALVQARMARILRCSDYNLDTKTLVLWTQPSS